MSLRPIHPDFTYYLKVKEQEVIDLFVDVRAFLLELYPDSNELLYHTHALTAVFSLSDKVSDAFCLVPIYSNHMNLGFSKGTLLDDPKKLLEGTGKLMRHIPIRTLKDYRNAAVKKLIRNAIDFALEDMDRPTKVTGETVSKIKKT